MRALSLTEVPGDTLKGLEEEKYYASQIDSVDLGPVSLTPWIKIGTHASEGRLYEAFTMRFEGRKISEIDGDLR